ncbi:MFS transporter [Terrabacter sp. MAHUQ-38]|uniref:MFS transporter n=1 Tax=unclassified Terrabacter TaxID=2630222 RepID=UPI00351BFA64
MSLDQPARDGRGVVLAVILGCQLMMALDASIVTTALPHIRTELGFSESSLSWIQNSYVLVFGGLLLLGARAGDLLGRRRVFLSGVALFTAASLLAGLAPGAGILIAARAFQGLASAFAIPSTLALLLTSFPAPQERARAIAVYSAVIGAGGSIGIIVGGLFTEYLSWRWGLIVNVPIGVAILVLAPRYLPETPRKQGQVDVLGAVSITLGMSSVVFGLVEAAQSGWTDVRTALPLTVGVCLIAAFVAVERRTPQPVVPLRLFASVQRSGAYLGRILIVGAMFSTFYFLSQYLQNVRGLSPLATGLAFIPMTGMFFAMVYVVRGIGSRLSRPALLLASLVTALAGMAWLSRIDATTAFWPWILLPLLVLGVGQGIAIILFTELGVAEVEPDDAGAASGLVNTAHQLGGSLGLALLTVVYGAAVHHDATPVAALAAHGYATVFAAATVFYAFAVIVGVTILTSRRRQRLTPGPAVAPVRLGTSR